MADSYPVPLEDVPASQIYRAKDVQKFGFLKKKAGGMKLPFIQDPCKFIVPGIILVCIFVILEIT